MKHAIVPMEEPFGTKGGTLPPFLKRFQRLNEEYNTRLLIQRLVSALLRYHLRKHCQNKDTRMTTHL